MSGKSKRFFMTVAVLFAAVVMVFAVACDGYELFVAPEISLSEADEFALQQYLGSELADTRATLRADTMYVTERNIARPKPELLSDDYSLVYDRDTGRVTPFYEKKSGENTSSITFKDYPYPSGKGNDNDGNNFYKNLYADQAYEAFGLGTSSTQEEKDSAKQAYYYYYKYMLLSQGYNLAIEAQTRSKNGTLTQEWLKKHPAADLQYGEVKGSDNAVQKVIVLDPIYRSYHATGLYLPAGELVTVKVEGLKTGESISMFIGLNNSLAWRGNGEASDEAKAKLEQMAGGSGLPLTGPSNEQFFTYTDALAAGGYFFDKSVSTQSFIQGQWNRQNNRAPWITAEFTFDKDGEYMIGTPFGGIMHIDPKNCYSSVKTTVRGAVETPHYILGVTTPEYYEQYLVSEDTAPGVYAVIDTENGQLVGPASYMRANTRPDEVEQLAYLWHTFFAVNETFTGGTYNRNNLVKFDQHVPAGAAVALGGYVYACPTDWFGSATNYRSLLRSGSWGILHEIGHNHGSAYGTVWGMGGEQEGEVRNNALTCLAYLKFCDIGSTITEDGNVPAEHGFVAHPYSSLANTINLREKGTATDFNGLGYFDALNIYTNIMHSFGVDKFYELLYTYKDNPSYVARDESGVAVGNKRSDFVYRLALIYGMNFRPYVDGIFKGNTADTDYTAEQLELMNSLPVYHPVANLYAGGIDGVKTGGDYTLHYGEEKEFDLAGKTITTADGFEIVKVSSPEHGKLTDMGEGKYKYSFNPKYTGNTDSFSFDVLLSDGVAHRLTVYLRYTFAGATVLNYGAVESDSLDEAASYVLNNQPIESLSASHAGVPTYKNDAANKYELRTSEFWYKAPESGEFAFSVSADDKARVYFGESFGEIESKLDVPSYTSGFSDKTSFVVELQKDKCYAFRIININSGGNGGASLGVKYGSSAVFTAVPSTSLRLPTLQKPEQVQEYVFEPKLIVSKKEGALQATMNSDKSEWTVLQAPEDIVGGRYSTEQMVDPDTGAVIGELVTDKRNWLIDGQTGTIFHTVWQGNVTPATDENPDVFVIDTNREQFFNYFRIVAPNRSDYRIKRYELAISIDGEKYTKIAEGTADSPLEYSGTTANITFQQVSGRYLKLTVKETTATNSNYTVISELEAGITSSAQMVYPSGSNKYYLSEGWSTVRAGDDVTLRSGLAWTEKKQSKLVIKIKSSSISLYADKGVGYGTADIKVDGKLMQKVSLASDTPQSRCLIFNAEGLKENKEHTVEIITTSNAPFNLDLVGASYNSVLINAPNIYKERALTISLVVFILLFVVVVALLCVITFVPSVREKLLGGKKKEKKSKKSDDKPTPPSSTARPSSASTAARPTSPKVRSVQSSARTTTPPASASRPSVTARPTTRTTPTARPVSDKNDGRNNGSDKKK